MGLDSRKVFVRRDAERNLLPDQLKRFEDLRRRCGASAETAGPAHASPRDKNRTAVGPRPIPTASGCPLLLKRGELSELLGQQVIDCDPVPVASVLHLFRYR